MNLIYVVDACTAIKWFVPENDAIQASLPLDGRARLVAPELILIEAANVLSRKQRAGEIDEQTSELILTRIPALLECLVPLPVLAQSARRLSVEINHPARDTTYLALAIAMGGPVITADQTFCRRAQRSRYKEHVLFLRDLR